MCRIPLAAFPFFSLSLILFSFNLMCLSDDSLLFVLLGVLWVIGIPEPTNGYLSSVLETLSCFSLKRGNIV